MKKRMGAGLNSGSGQILPETSRPIMPMPQTGAIGQNARKLYAAALQATPCNSSVN
jgi:hypothetical protein